MPTSRPRRRKKTSAIILTLECYCDLICVDWISIDGERDLVRKFLPKTGERSPPLSVDRNTASELVPRNSS